MASIEVSLGQPSFSCFFSSSSVVDRHSTATYYKTSLTTVHDLPVEVLQKVFTYCTEPCTPAESYFIYPVWIAIAHVCSHWRSVALNHHSLWASITPNLSTDWSKAFVTRSEPALMDVDLFVSNARFDRNWLSLEDIIDLLANCTRLRSLQLVGQRQDVCAALGKLKETTPINELSLSVWERDHPTVLPDDLFGGEAPVRHLRFTSDSFVVAPRWLFRGVTHFTSTEEVPLIHLLNTLRHMPALTHFTLRSCMMQWNDHDAPRGPLIEMPHLTDFVVEGSSPSHFALLIQRLAMPRIARKRLELCTSVVSGWDHWASWFPILSSIIEAAGGMQQICVSGAPREGSFSAWTGGDATGVYEEAEFALKVIWEGCPATLQQQGASGAYFNSPIFHLGALWELVEGAMRARKLVLKGGLAARSQQLPASWWWRLLETLPVVEELELHPDSVEALFSAWRESDAPAVLPALRRVHIAQAESTVFCTPAITEGSSACLENAGEVLMKLLRGDHDNDY